MKQQCKAFFFLECFYDFSAFSLRGLCTIFKITTRHTVQNPNKIPNERLLGF